MLLNNSSLKKNLIFGALLAASAALVIAGDGGKEFEAVYEMIEGWATGTLGKVLNFGPSVISNILTATGEVDMAGVAMLANGLGM